MESPPSPVAPAQAGASAPTPRPIAKGIDLIQVLTTAVQKNGSDVVFTAGTKPRIRIGGRLRTFGDEVLTPESVKRVLYSLLTDDQKAHFEETLEIDLAVELRGVGRFRLNGFRQRGHAAAVLRLIPAQLPSVQSLELPQVIQDIADYPRGLVLVTGPTGSGKSTLLAALLAKINAERECHVITIEDPIEFVHPHLKAVIEQREVGSDTKSFANALKYVLRQNPDVILVGEMRDPETIAAALTLAETGHLVFSTLHTQTSAQTMDRIIDTFPYEAQNQIRSQLALTLRAVVSQCLIPTPEGTSMVAAREVMVVTPAISALIREGKGHMIKNFIETGRQHGMNTMEAAIQDLINRRMVDQRDALIKMNAVRAYLPTGSKAPSALHTAELRRGAGQSELPLDVDDVPTPLSGGYRAPRRLAGPPLDLEMPAQPLVIFAGLVAAGAVVYAYTSAATAPFTVEQAAGVLGGCVLIFAVRFGLARQRIKSELKRMLDQG